MLTYNDLVHNALLAHAHLSVLSAGHFLQQLAMLHVASTQRWPGTHPKLDTISQNADLQF